MDYGGDHSRYGSTLASHKCMGTSFARAPMADLPSAKMGSQVLVPFRGSEDNPRHLKLMGDLGQIVPMKYDPRDENSIKAVIAKANVVIKLIGREYETRNFSFEEVNHFMAEQLAVVKIVKCTVNDIPVDISFNQTAGLSALCFLETVDQLIGKDHLFKRSIFLIKAWCYYESRILGFLGHDSAKISRNNHSYNPVPEDSTLLPLYYYLYYFTGNRIFLVLSTTASID
ncbi:hypothetical protein PVK06_000618 [Gossypium arboreum]|uniref:PAP/OAS1 substrate-binding-related domain-containing protein n=1 Tax=Gossypium arboreum TaxID=29729 RepID=A0ABR0R052_GOSAR|nr:hypothetical protein PVK06_000618 [Gossypium arboreum]